MLGYTNNITYIPINEIKNMNIKMISCSECKKDMPELRLTQYNYSFCVECSEAGMGSEAKKAITVLKGEGDHTWVETIIMSDSDYNSYLSEKEEDVKRSNENKVDIEDDKNIQGPFKIINAKEK
jgi:hypothetical protein|tara:strand:- start:39 stop:410 length:372 start_codon:yes stop_codon:yes gene_type:complete